MIQAFLDTGYLLALENRRDQHHDAAVAHWAEYAPRRTKLVTTSLVFVEVVTFLNKRGRHDKAIKMGRRLLEESSIELVYVGESLFQDGWEFLQQHADKRYSLADCVSFVVMRDRGIRQALAFDRHFEQAGFERLP